MTEDNEHAKNSYGGARQVGYEAQRVSRRSCDAIYAGRVLEEMLERFARLQGTIAAIEDAIKHERQLAGQEPGGSCRVARRSFGQAGAGQGS